MRKILRFLLLFLCLQSGISQTISNEFIVESRLDKEAIRNILRNNRLAVDEASVRLLSEDLSMYCITASLQEESKVRSLLKDNKHFTYLGNNQFLKNRQAPNDVLFAEQWALAFAKIPEVWNVTTGGLAFDGEELVIAVLDDGIDIEHEDIRDNIFINSKEIPGDKIDNDGNGYVDDHKGFNVDQNNGTPVSLNHGSGVSGIMGARGNNQIGVSGINWRIKILPIYGVNKLDEIITAYSYVLKMKRLYLSTQGNKGALVVVTNYSGGISKAWGNEEPYKQWCVMYDLLGAEGVLSVGATDNEAVNVDVIGDMPSTCSSDYFISTTNIDQTGKKVFRAGFGSKFIAMAAPGENLTTISKNDGYVKAFSGTSASSPMVAGTIALLFSIPCEAFSVLMKNDKSGAALAVRNAILNGVTKTNELKDQTKYGGYLNAEGALALMDEPCDGKLLLPSPKGEIAITSITSENGKLFINYLTPDETDYDFIISNTLGQVYYRQKLNVPIYGDKKLVIYSDLWPRGIYIVSIIGKTGAASRMLFSE